MVIAYVSVQWNPSLVETLSVETSPEYPHPRKEKNIAMAHRPFRDFNTLLGILSSVRWFPECLSGLKP